MECFEDEYQSHPDSSEIEGEKVDMTKHVPVSKYTRHDTMDIRRRTQTTLRLNDLVKKAYRTSLETPNFTILSNGIVFDCSKPEGRKTLIDWAKSRGAKENIWIISVTDNKGRFIGQLMNNLKQFDDLVDELDNAVRRGTIAGWGIGGFIEKDGYSLDFSIVLIDKPESDMVKLARAERTLFYEQMPQRYAMYINLKSNRCELKNTEFRFV